MRRRGFIAGVLRRPQAGRALTIGLLTIGLSTAGLSMMGGCAPSDESRPPDIILFVLDTVRADAVDFEGVGPDVTPALRALAADGVVFRNAFTHTTWTKPAMATLFTSRYPMQHSIRSPTDEEGGELVSSTLPEGFDTLAERLQAAGYETFGALNQIHLLEKYRFNQGFETYHAFRGAGPRELNRLLREWVTARGPEETRPAFVYMHYLQPHWPYRERVDSLREALGPLEMESPPPRYGNEVEAWIGDGLAEGDLRALKARYAHGVASADRFMGRALRALEAAGLAEDAVIVVTSDHGEGMFEHGKLLHGFEPYDEVHRIPLLIRLPANGRPNVREVDELVGLVDLLPTLVDLAGLEPQEGDMGRSLVPLLEGTGRITRRPVFSDNVNVRSLRTADHKLMRFSSGKELFFDLRADPEEARPVPCDETCQNLGRQLDELVELLKLTSTTEGESIELEESDLERLRALGYLD